MRLAVIGTFHQRHENTYPLVRRLFLESSRVPDEAWLIGETYEDVAEIARSLEILGVDFRPDVQHLKTLPTPRDHLGRYSVIPYSLKINWALDRSDADLFCYLDNNSMPAQEKFEFMAESLEAHPEWGAVYCSQKHTGFDEGYRIARDIVPDAYCRLNYTQVMHRRTDARWTLDMRHADPDLADALFWRALHERVGPFYPVAGTLILDTHHIPNPKAVGV